MTTGPATLAPRTLAPGVSEELAQRARAHLREAAGRAAAITYRELAEALGLTPPQTIRQVTEVLEELMREDAASGRPLLAALVVSRARGGMPAPGFFDCAQRLGRFDGPASGTEAWGFHEAELAAAIAFWSDAAQDAKRG